jgi:transcriptional regulator with XRE-family HTH domain
MENKETIGSLLRAARKSFHLTTEQLANIAGVDRTYITKIEKHNNLPSLAIMQIICDKLQANELFKKYLKIKYPTRYEKLEKDEATREVGYLGCEFQRIKEEVEKIKNEEITPGELKKLKERIFFFGNDVNRSVVRLQKLIEELQKIKKLHSNLKNTLKQKEK